MKKGIKTSKEFIKIMIEEKGCDTDKILGIDSEILAKEWINSDNVAKFLESVKEKHHLSEFQLGVIMMVANQRQQEMQEKLQRMSNLVDMMGAIEPQPKQPTDTDNYIK